MNKIFFFLLAVICLSCTSEENLTQNKIDLSGEWQFDLDTTNIGIDQQWYVSDLGDHIELPGTTDSNEKGFLNTDTTTSHLNRLYTYEGIAWYRKKITIPKDYKDKYISLYFERTKPSKIWVDSTLIGGSKLLQSPHQFDVSAYLSPGEHYITVQINNNLELTPYGQSHIYSNDTQTNWNGILGEMFIEAKPKTHIVNLQVFPDIDNQKFAVELNIENEMQLEDFTVKMILKRINDGDTIKLSSKTIDTTISSQLKVEYYLGDETRLWDEYNQPLYHLTTIISKDDMKDFKSISFGMRKFAIKGTQFTINGRTTFLRGKHDAAVFPITGHTPMDVESWKRIFKIAKSYGINHYRFHTYTPPEAAFTAADEIGIYLQSELPFWGGLESDSVADMLRKEGNALLRTFTNHPSFVMFSHGNEIWSGHDRVEENIKAFKEYDSRPLYTMGSNNNIGFVAPREVSDFFVASRTPSDGDTTLTHTRLSHAFIDSKNGGLLNSRKPSSMLNFNYPVSQLDIPIISHEIGQYQIYPDYKEIEKYTGVLRARNLEVFRENLKQAGMLDQDSIFQQASGAWSALCYKAEMEAAISTKGFGGFQLLDLQDFPGQGTALVGILDAFMDSKEVISRQKWIQSCNDVVLLAKFPKYVWSSSESFNAKVEVANYSNKPLAKALNWQLAHSDGSVIRKGRFTNNTIENGGLSLIGKLQINLSKITEAEKVILTFSLEDKSYSNTYPIWVYPETKSIPETGEVLIAKTLNSKVITELSEGGKVLLFPSTEKVSSNSVPGLFPPNFWNYEMFKNISQGAGKPYSPGTLGLLTDPDHPLFAEFPTDFHTNWQWFSIIKHSNALILDNTKDDYRPIVQVIDNLQRNHKLGMIFEFRVGKGKLLVCMSQLTEILENPEAAQLYKSLLGYMNSEKFNPQYHRNTEQIKELIF